MGIIGLFWFIIKKQYEFLSLRSTSAGKDQIKLKADWRAVDSPKK